MGSFIRDDTSPPPPASPLRDYANPLTVREIQEARACEKVSEKSASIPEAHKARVIGYHVREIPRGVYGEPSKIYEECEEFRDAIEQDSMVLAINELSDLYGAIKAYVEARGWSMTDLAAMSEITERAFESGERTSRPK